VKSLTEPRFAVYVSAHVVSQIGTWVQQVAIGWFAWEISHSEAVLGLLVFCQFAPSLFITPIAGNLADRRGEAPLVVGADGIAGIVSLSLGAIALTGNLSIAWLIASSLIIGCSQSFSHPARQVFITRIVKREHLTSAVSINSVSMSIARSVGPLGAAYLISSGDLPVAFFWNGISSLLDAAALWLVRERGARKVDTGRTSGGWREFLHSAGEGLRTVNKEPSLRLVFFMYLLYSALGRPVLDLLPAIVDSIMGGDARLLGQINSLFGVVGIVTGVLMSIAIRPERLILAETVSMLLMAIGTALLAQSTGADAGLIAISVFSVGQVAVNITSTSAAQLSSSVVNQGRVMALHVLTFRCGAAFGGLLVGGIAKVVGLWETLIGIAAILSVVFIYGVLQKSSLEIKRLQ
jgi:MFS family permease